MLEDRVFGIVGLGKSGRAVLEFLTKRGIKVVAIDDNLDLEMLKNKYPKGVEFYDMHIPDDVLDSIDLLVVSPGVSLSHPVVKKVSDGKKEIMGEMELAYRYKKDGYIVAVTGTNGKTTTSYIISDILKTWGKNTVLAGNVGTPFISVIDRDYDFIVLEVSSFQLETISAFKPDMAILLNASEDHIDRHGSRETYFDIKKRIFKNQCKEDTAILNQDDARIRALSDVLVSKVFLFGEGKRYRNTYAYISDDEIVIHGEKKDLRININRLRNRARPFIYNMMAGTLAASVLGAPYDAIEKVAYSFTPLPHRMEYVDTIGGVEFINDSKATNPDAVFWALSTFPNHSVILIMGGKDKNLSFEKIRDILDKKVKSLILMGQAREKLNRVLSFSPTYVVDSMKEAVEIAYKIAQKGDRVLLSPGCTSWDMYKNFEERGEDFKNCVKRLKERNNEGTGA